MFSSTGLCKIMRIFWNLYFIMKRTRRRKFGHGSFMLNSMEGSSSCQWMTSASYADVSDGVSSGDSTSRSWILVVILQNSDAWIRGRNLSCSKYWGLFGWGKGVA